MPILGGGPGPPEPGGGRAPGPPAAPHAAPRMRPPSAGADDEAAGFPEAALLLAAAWARQRGLGGAAAALLAEGRARGLLPGRPLAFGGVGPPPEIADLEPQLAALAKENRLEALLGAALRGGAAPPGAGPGWLLAAAAGDGREGTAASSSSSSKTLAARLEARATGARPGRAEARAGVPPAVLGGRFRHLRTLRGHRAPVYCVAFTPDGAKFVTGSDDRLVKVWSARTGALLCACRGHCGDVTDLAVDPAGAWAATSSNDNTVRVWSLRDASLGRPVATFAQHGKPVLALQAAPGRPGTLLSASEDGVWVWEAATGLAYGALRPRALPRPDAPSAGASGPDPRVQAVAFSACGRYAAAGCSDKTARVWHLPAGMLDAAPRPADEFLLREAAAAAAASQPPQQGRGAQRRRRPVAVPPRPVGALVGGRGVEGHKAAVEFLAFSRGAAGAGPAGLLTCAKDGRVIVWRPARGRGAAPGRGVTLGGFEAACALAAPPSPFELERYRRGEVRRKPQPAEPLLAAWTLDDARVVASFKDRTVRVFCPEAGAPLHTFARLDLVYVLAPHPRDPRLVLAAGYDGRAEVLDAAAGRTVAQFNTADDCAWSTAVGAGAVYQLTDGQFSADGTALVVSDLAGQVSLYGVRDRATLLRVPYDQFFRTELNPIITDLLHNVVDAETKRAPRSRIGADVLCDVMMERYPEPLQSAFTDRRLDAIPLGLAEKLQAATQRSARILPPTVTQALARDEAGAAAPRPAAVRGLADLPPGAGAAADAAADAEGPDAFEAPVTLDDLRDFVPSDDSDEEGDEDEDGGEAGPASPPAAAPRDGLRSGGPPGWGARRSKRARRVVWSDDETEESSFRTSSSDAGSAGAPEWEAGPSAPLARPPRARPKAVLEYRPTHTRPRGLVAYAWLQAERRPFGAYVPQLGDAVVYVPQGHEAYLRWCDSVGTGGAEGAIVDPPWVSVGASLGATMDPQGERCKVVGLEYVLAKDSERTLARAQLKIADAGAGAGPGRASRLHGRTFSVDLPHPSDAQPDFLVAEAAFDAGRRRRLLAQARCKVFWADRHHPAGGEWWEGAVAEESDLQPGVWAGSPWERLVVQYDSGDRARHSPWEVHRCRERVEEHGVELAPGGEALGAAAREAVAAALAEERFGLFAETPDRDLSFDSRAEKKRAIKVYYNTFVPLPLGLAVVAARLRHGYYRQREAAFSDVRLIAKNAELFNGPDAPVTLEAQALAAALEAVFEGRHGTLREALVANAGRSGGSAKSKGKAKVKRARRGG